MEQFGEGIFRPKWAGGNSRLGHKRICEKRGVSCNEGAEICARRIALVTPGRTVVSRMQASAVDRFVTILHHSFFKVEWPNGVTTCSKIFNWNRRYESHSCCSFSDSLHSQRRLLIC